MTAPRDLPPLTIDRRYCGPPSSANGGYLAGRLAAYLGAGPVRVTLVSPPPLDAAIEVSSDGAGGVRASADGRVVAEAAPAALEDDDVDPVSFPVASQAGLSYAGLANHPFPTCFACGTARSAPDGLALRPGRLPDAEGTTATAWIPVEAQCTDDGHVPVEVVWAALDCPGGWTMDLVGRPAVLGRITASVDALPEAGERCVVMARLLAYEGRKARTSTTLYDGEGRVLARARSTWIQVDPATFGGSAAGS